MDYKKGNETLHSINIVSCFSLRAIGSCSKAVCNRSTTSETNRVEFLHPARQSPPRTSKSAKWIFLHRCVHCSRELPDTQDYGKWKKKMTGHLFMSLIACKTQSVYERETREEKKIEPTSKSIGLKCNFFCASPLALALRWLASYLYFIILTFTVLVHCSVLRQSKCRNRIKCKRIAWRIEKKHTHTQRKSGRKEKAST